MNAETVPNDLLANYFVRYLFENYGDRRHIRQVASWLGFLLKAIERVANGTLRGSRTRQLVFRYRGRRFKARYSHHAGPRGGIQIVQVLRGRGAPEGDVAVTVTTLDEAEQVYLGLEGQLDQFLNG
jgi:hypothetical protein